MQNRMQIILYFAVIVAIAMTIFSCSVNDPELIPNEPDIPVTPVDTIPQIPSDSIQPDTTSTLEYDSISAGINPSVNGWGIDGNDNGGIAQ